MRILVMVLGFCATLFSTAFADGAPQSLANTVWEYTFKNDPEPTRIVEFFSDGHFEGKFSCGAFKGIFGSDGQFTVTTYPSKASLCTNFELKNALKKATHYKVKKSTLIFFDNDNKILFKLNKRTQTQSE